jgi:hypothetical protein
VPELRELGGVLVTPAHHRRLADELVQYVWSLIERTDRGPDDDAEMVHAAHAARWHRARAEGCGPQDLATAEWQISHVYAITGRSEPSTHHAQRSLELCRTHRLGGYLLAYAYEALARAAAVGGDDVGCEKWLEKAWAAAEEVSDPATRERIEADLGGIRAG